MTKYWYEETVDKNGVHTGHFSILAKFDDATNVVLVARCFSKYYAELVVRALNNEDTGLIDA